MSPLRLLSAALALLISAPLARADLLTGRIVGPGGVGVQNVDIDAFDLVSGNEEVLANDATDVNGNFTTTIPAGLFLVRFRPPAPPLTTLLVLEVDNVVVSGTRNLGTLTLQQGVLLSGRAVDTAAAPVANLNLDVVDGATGLELTTPNDRTDSFGNFQLVVPAAPIEVQFRTDQLGSSLAPRALALSPTGTTNLGNVVLQPGFLLTGRIQRTNGTPVVGADLDLRTTAGGTPVFTPRDNTDSSGDFSLLVPSGTFDLEVCPRAADLLVATERTSILVSTGTNLGTLTLAAGVTLSGTVTGAGALPLAGVDLDVRNRTTGVAVLLCEDNTNAAGQYSVIVPTGSYDLTFTPPAGSCYGRLSISNVTVSGSTVRNATLPGPFTATASVFAGDGVNLDLVTPVPVRPGQTWSAPLTLGNAHGAGGAAVLKVRTSVVNGPTVTSPVGGRPVEALIAGPLLATIPGSHNGTSGGIAPVLIPNQSSLLGLPWSAQYTVSGGGFVDLSRAVFGIVGCP